MAQLTVRKVDESVVQALRLRAARNGRSAESEHREILRNFLLPEASRPSLEDFLRTLPDVGDDADFARIGGSIREVDL